MKILVILILGFSTVAGANDHMASWKKDSGNFSDAEANFKLAMKKILDSYVDKSVDKNALYKAATDGMLKSLNSGDQAWNELLSPDDLKEIEIEMSGKVVGVGAAMKFDESTGYARVLNVIAKSPAEKAGMKTDDQILSVDGKKFKGKAFRDLVYSIRGDAGKSVNIKVLREDKIVSLDIKREVVPWTPVELQSLGDGTAVLTIGYFNEETPKGVSEMLAKVNSDKITKLIIDMRENSGGGFDQAVKTAELFLPHGTLIVSTKSRDGKTEEYKSKNSVLNPQVQIVLLTNKGTKSGGELFTAALKENKNLKTVGEATYGKWNAQTIDILPNKYAVKFTVKEFMSPKGKSFQGEGLKPDIEVGLAKDLDIRELRSKYDIKKRVLVDNQLKAAAEVIKAL